MGEGTSDWELVARDRKVNTPRNTSPRIVISSEARNLFHWRSGGRWQETKTGSCYQETFGHRPVSSSCVARNVVCEITNARTAATSSSIAAKPPPISLPHWGRLAIRGEPALKRPSGIGAFRHPERSEMSDVRKYKGGTVRTESKDLALPQTCSPPFSLRPCPVSSPHLVHIQEAREMIQ